MHSPGRCLEYAPSIPATGIRLLDCTVPRGLWYQQTWHTDITALLIESFSAVSCVPVLSQTSVSHLSSYLLHLAWDTDGQLPKSLNLLLQCNCEFFFPKDSLFFFKSLWYHLNWLTYNKLHN